MIPMALTIPAAAMQNRCHIHLRLLPIYSNPENPKNAIAIRPAVTQYDRRSLEVVWDVIVLQYSRGYRLTSTIAIV